MKRIGLVLLLFMLLLVMVASNNTRLMIQIYPYLYEARQFGDLYGFSYLSAFKKPLLSCPAEKNQVNKGNKIRLYILGDSFTELFQNRSDYFENVCSFTFSHPLKNILYTPLKKETGKKNVLVIEVIERRVRYEFGKKFQSRVCGIEIDTTLEKEIFVNKESAKPFRDVFWEFRHPKGGQNRTVDQYIEDILFSNPLVNTVKEWKAEFNFRLFNQIDKNVVMSKDRKFLFYAPDVDLRQNTCSYNPLKESESTNIASNISEQYTYYKSLGFDEVIFSFIPNKETIESKADFPFRYNNLIPLVAEELEHRHIPFIDTYRLFSNAGVQLYYENDSHWNCVGRKLWAEELNKSLSSI